MTTKISVVDMLMGSGKSTQSLKYIEHLALNKERWVFCTEYLSEIDDKICTTNDDGSISPRDGWKLPIDDVDLNKTQNLARLVRDDSVHLIAITHNHLLQLAQEDYYNILSDMQRKGYKLYLDETIELMSVYNNIKYGDFLLALNDKRIAIDEDNYGKVTWVDSTFESVIDGNKTALDHLKLDAEKDRLYALIRGGSVSTKGSVSIVDVVGKHILSSFSEVLITTYQFENTTMAGWMYMHNLQWEYNTTIKAYREITKEQISTLTTLDSKYYKKLSKLSLSSGWYEDKKKATKENIKLINSVIANYANSKGCKENPHLLGYTVPQASLGATTRSGGIYPNGYRPQVCLVSLEEVDKHQSCYIACNTRASNSYAHKKVMVHVFNRFMNPQLTSWMCYYNIPYSEDVFAINELIQWVWRAAIRSGESIDLLIGSERMRGLFLQWIKSSATVQRND